MTKLLADENVPIEAVKILKSWSIDIVSIIDFPIENSLLFVKEHAVRVVKQTKVLKLKVAAPLEVLEA